MLAISIRQPWAWAIMHLGKRIENRGSPDPWRKAVGQRIWLHASSWRGKKGEMAAEFEAMVRCATMAGSSVKGWPGTLNLDYGGIVGSAVIDDVIRMPSADPRLRTSWACGPWCLVLDYVRPEPFRPCKGSLGLWEPTIDI